MTENLQQHCAKTDPVKMTNKWYKYFETYVAMGGGSSPPEEVLSPTAILNFPDQGIFLAEKWPKVDEKIKI